MWFPNFFQSLTSIATRRRSRRTPLASRLGFEPLEERRLLAFLAPVSYSVGGYSASITSADFNGDGRADLAATGFSGGAVRLGNGDGTFQATLSQPGAGSELTAGDLNGDSKTDLVSINDLQLRVLLGNGDGTFQPPQVISLPSQLPPGAGSYLVQQPTSVVLGDLNADGLLDLIAGGYDEVVYGYGESRHDGYVNVLLGNGNGTFAPNAAYRVADNSLIAVLGVGDFDGDGKSDVLATDHYRLSTLVGNGNGTLQAAPNTSDVGFFTSGTSDPVADFDRDGKLDVFLGATVARGNGDGTFTPSGLVTFGAAVQSVDVGDVNADGKLDIVGLSSINQPSSDVDYTSSRFARILLGNGDGSFAAPLVSQLGTIPAYGYFSVALLADFDGDGSPDLAASDYQNWNGMVSGRVTVSLNDGIWSSLPPTPPVVSIGDATVTEGNLGTSVATFIVTLTAASSQPVTVAYASANGTAGSGDYQAAAGTLTILAGQTTRTITVLVNGDRLGEANETFFVSLSNPTGATIADGQGAGTIVDDEPRISISDVSKSEGRRSRTTLFTFTVTLSAAYDQLVTMSYRTVNGTATTAGGDYIARTGTLFFAPGETTKTITISVKGDSKREGNETFYLDLFGNSSNSLFTKNRGIGTILNDD